MSRDAQSQVRQPIWKYRAGESFSAEDVLAAEEPLEIRLIWQEEGKTVRRSIAVTMRTPGNDFELATGFLYGESIVSDREDIVDVAYCTEEEEPQAYNIVTVTLRPGLRFDAGRLERNFYTTSSCGVCGKATLDALAILGCEALPAGPRISGETLRRLPDTLRKAQTIFEATGGLHAVGLFDTEGTLLSLQEDVGRHNALDKLVGEQLLANALPLNDRVLLLSGRASFELVQKALRAQIPVVASVGAPSSLAQQVAEAFGMTLAGFLRADSFNVYSGRERLV